MSKLKWILIIIIGIMIYNNSGGVDKSKNTISKVEFEQEKTKLLNKQFNTRKAHIISKLNSAIEKKDLDAINSIRSSYSHITDKDFLKTLKKSEIVEADLIINKLKSIPTKKTKLNYQYYKRLVELKPSISRYKKKMDYYNNILIDKEAKEVAKKIFYGDKPTASGWDGSYFEVKNYLKRVMKDPSSLDIVSCSNVYKIDNIGWAVNCSYRGKNSFGALTLNSNWFIIRRNIVVSVKENNAYSIK